MPTLAYLTQVTQGSPGDISIRGFDDGLWEDLLSLDLACSLKWKVLSAGPCPNARRVFFQLVGEPDVEGRDEPVADLLGQGSFATRREAGRQFHAWVAAANQEINEWLSTSGQLTFSGQIPERLAGFYAQRAECLGQHVANLSLDGAKAVMNVEQAINTRGLPFGAPTPDGAWVNMPSQFALGVFEAKLTPPPEPCDVYLLTAYAALLEWEHRRPCDYGVLLSLDSGSGQLCCDPYYLGEVARDHVRQNIEHFASLIAWSRLQGQDVISDQKQLDVTQLCRPECPERGPACPRCWYRGECRGQT